MFMQGPHTSRLPPLRPHRDRRPYHRPMTADAQRLRLLLHMVDIRNRTEFMMRNLMHVTATAAIQTVSLMQKALYDVYVRMQRLLKTSTQEIISTIDAPNRFQRFMGNATSLLHESSANQKKFEALESELKMLKEQMAWLIQGHAHTPAADAGNSSAILSATVCPAKPSVPVPPPAPPCPPALSSSSNPYPACSLPTISFLDELICSDISESEGDDDFEFTPKSGISGEGVPSRSALNSTSIGVADSRFQNRPSFAEQIQERNRVGLRKTRIDRSPGGTPLKRNSVPGSEGFHQEILANALFRKFQNVRADESPERRRSKKHERNGSSPHNTGLASLFEGEVQDDEWCDKENF